MTSPSNSQNTMTSDVITLDNLQLQLGAKSHMTDILKNISVSVQQGNVSPYWAVRCWQNELADDYGRIGASNGWHCHINFVMIIPQ